MLVVYLLIVCVKPTKMKWQDFQKRICFCRNLYVGTGLGFCLEGMQQNPSIIIQSRLCSKMQHLTPYHPKHINVGLAIGRNSSGRPMRTRKTTRTARHVGPPNSRGTGNWQQSLDSCVSGRTLVDQCVVSQCKSRAPKNLTWTCLRAIPIVL